MPKRLFSLTALILLLFIGIPSLSGCSAIASYLLYQWMEDEFGSGDDEDREEPFVRRIMLDRDVVHINDQVLLTCEAEDNRDEPNDLEYYWNVSAGVLADPQSRVTIWQVPNQNGTATLSIVVTDTDGYQATATVDINVQL